MVALMTICFFICKGVLMWDVKICFYCNTINQIPIHNNFPAWECCCCLNKHWMNEMRHGYDDYDLVNDLVPVLHGQHERDSSDSPDL